MYCFTEYSAQYDCIVHMQPTKLLIDVSVTYLTYDGGINEVASAPLARTVRVAAR